MRDMMAIFACAVALCGCNPILPVAPAHPAADPRPLSGPAPADAAVVVLVYPEASWEQRVQTTDRSGNVATYTVTQRAREWVDVIDERGELVARLGPHTWTVLREDPGRRRLYAVPAFAGWSHLHAYRTGALDVRLRGGRYYYVQVSEHQAPSCVGWGDASLDLEPAIHVGVLDHGVRDTLQYGQRVAPPPRGILHSDPEGIARAASARSVVGSCIERRADIMDDRDSTVVPFRASGLDVHGRASPRNAASASR